MIKIPEISVEVINLYKKYIPESKITQKIDKIKNCSLITNCQHKQFCSLLKNRINLEKILFGSLDSILDFIQSNTTIINAFNNDYENCFKQGCPIKNIFNYKNFTDADVSYNIAEKMNINVCPYCNRNYTYTVKKTKTGTKDSNKVTRPEFDHFISKSKYPFLALSLHNFVPSCHTCNHVKNDEDFSLDTHINPYNEGFDDDFVFQIGRQTDIEALIRMPGKTVEHHKLEIDLKAAKGCSSDKATRCQNNVKDFHLKDIYQKHSDLVADLIEKARMYNNDSYKTSINSIFGNKTNLFWGNYYETKDLGKRPFAKLTRDFLKQFKIIS